MRVPWDTAVLVVGYGFYGTMIVAVALVESKVLRKLKKKLAHLLGDTCDCQHCKPDTDKKAEEKPAVEHTLTATAWVDTEAGTLRLRNETNLSRLYVRYQQGMGNITANEMCEIPLTGAQLYSPKQINAAAEQMGLSMVDTERLLESLKLVWRHHRA